MEWLGQKPVLIWDPGGYKVWALASRLPYLTLRELLKEQSLGFYIVHNSVKSILVF